MRWLLSATILAVGAIMHGSLAQAGAYTDDLSKCLVKSTNPADQLALVQWMFSAMSLNPAVRPLVSITDAQRARFDKQAASLFVRLVSDNCRVEAVDALKYEGPSALGMSFSVLGQVATRGLMSDPHVRAGMTQLGTYFDHNDKLEAVFAAAGLTPQGAPAGAPPK